MNLRTRPPLITFDTNLTGVWNTRVFWATLCEEIGQPMVLTPTAASETLRRVRLETEREWKKRLRELNREQDTGWSKTAIRRLSTTAAAAARTWFQDEFKKQGAIYALTRPNSQTIEREEEIDETIDDNAFDLTSDNGIQDRKIVIEAMARGFDILATNNVNTIDHGMLKDWLKKPGTKELGIETTILRPEPAEERLRALHGQRIEWTAHAAARACVTDPDDVTKASEEIAELISVFDEWGMSELKGRIYRLTKSKTAFHAVLESVTRHGSSQAMRSEREMEKTTAQAVTRRAGMEI